MFEGEPNASCFFEQSLNIFEEQSWFLRGFGIQLQQELYWLLSLQYCILVLQGITENLFEIVLALDCYCKVKHVEKREALFCFHPLVDLKGWVQLLLEDTQIILCCLENFCEKFSIFKQSIALFKKIDSLLIGINLQRFWNSDVNIDLIVDDEVNKRRQSAKYQALNSETLNNFVIVILALITSLKLDDFLHILKLTLNLVPNLCST